MRLPEWIKTAAGGQHSTKNLLRSHRLSTVCEEARCPNQGVCFLKPAAAFLIMGDICTRSCAFCAVTPGIPAALDAAEPERVAEAVSELGLRYVVITSVTRDDLADGGASHFAATIRALKKTLPAVKVEVLTPDFQGNWNAIGTVLEAGPDVFNHNIETVKRLYHVVRPQADYQRSLGVLKTAATRMPDIKIKSGLMIGLGETIDEVREVFRDMRSSGCDFLTVGQYLRPAKKNLPVVEYIHPDVFEALKLYALGLGFEFVASGPLVRSSMNAEEMYNGVNCES
jgi:lipoic acid synthetase